MLLAIDSGNTHIVFGLYQESQKVNHWRLKNMSDRPADEYIIFLNQWMAMLGYSHKDIEDVIIASVVPEALTHLKRMVEKYFKNLPFVIGEPGIEVKMLVKIDQPESLGADRLVNAFRGYQRYGGPLIIIDFGTATTFDVIDKEGSYIGGMIAPGVHLSLKALYQGAVKLPPTPFARTTHVIGKSTTTAIQAGCYWGYIDMIRGLCGRIHQEYVTSHGVSDITIIATGGLAGFLSQDLPIIQHVDESLTLDGLAAIYKEKLDIS